MHCTRCCLLFRILLLLLIVPDYFDFYRQSGKEEYQKFQIVKNDWNISDHCPITLQLGVAPGIDLNF